MTTLTNYQQTNFMPALQTIQAHTPAGVRVVWDEKDPEVLMFQKDVPFTVQEVVQIARLRPDDMEAINDDKTLLLYWY